MNRTALVAGGLAAGLLFGVGGPAFPGEAGVGQGGALPAEAVHAGSVETGAVQGTLRIEELGSDAGLRIRVYHAPQFIQVPASAGWLFLVCADSASGEGAFFIPTDMAIEIGEDLVYRVEFEQASDLFGQALGGRLRPGEAQVGFILIPPEANLDRYLPGTPEQVVVRYAYHRAPLAPAGEDDRTWWDRTVERPLLAAGLNIYWEWVQVIAKAPPMSEGDRRFFAERIFPGQGHVLAEEDVSAEALRNAILRVGEHRLLSSRITQRVAPRYPAAARQMNAHGLVVVLAYVTATGEVGDALILASNTVHLLNLAALSAAKDWRFARVTDADGNFMDGWRLIPIQFRLEAAAAVPAPNLAPAEGYQGPRIVKAVPAEYSTEALNRKLEGTVIYRVRLDAEGRLIEAILEQGVHPILDAAALAAVERTRFLPATQDGKPVPSEMRMPLAFGPRE
jgi:TonB family protein